MNWILRIYGDESSDEPTAHVEFFASTPITADKIALGIVEREFVGMDWTLTQQE